MVFKKRGSTSPVIDGLPGSATQTLIQAIVAIIHLLSRGTQTGTLLDSHSFRPI